MTKKKQLIEEILKLISNDFIRYFKIDKLSKDLGSNWSTTKENLILLDSLGIFKFGNFSLAHYEIINNFERLNNEDKLKFILNNSISRFDKREK